MYKRGKEKGMRKLEILYKDEGYHILPDNIRTTMFDDLVVHLKVLIKREMILMGTKDGFTITIEKGSKK